MVRTEIEDWRPSRFFPDWYHGTKLSLVENILKEGLVPGDIWVLDKCPHGIFVTGTKEEGMAWARQLLYEEFEGPLEDTPAVIGIEGEFEVIEDPFPMVKEAEAHIICQKETVPPEKLRLVYPLPGQEYEADKDFVLFCLAGGWTRSAPEWENLDDLLEYEKELTRTFKEKYGKTLPVEIEVVFRDAELSFREGR